MNNIGTGTYGHLNIDIKEWGEGAVLNIGKYCSIADRCTVFLGGNHRIDWVTTYPFNCIDDKWTNGIGITGHPSTNGDVNIGNDVWIGSNVTIMSGIEIGDGAVIGTNSLVTKDVKPYSIVGGNPAKLIKYRFSEEQIDSLLEIKWWDKSEEEINNIIPYLLQDDINLFIDICGNKKLIISKITLVSLES